MADTAVGPPPNAGSKTRRPSQRLASEEKICVVSKSKRVF